MEHQKVIEQLRTVYQGNKFQFDFQVAQMTAGDHNKELRRQIIEHVTGKRLPLTKCGMHAVSDVLKIAFDQLKLF